MDGVPAHPLMDGVTVMVAVIGVVPVLVAVKPGIFPLPLAGKPMPVFELVHAKVAPVVGLVNVVAGKASPLHTVLFAGTTTVVVGFTVIV